MYGCGRINTYRVLQTDMDYLMAALIQVRVSVWYVLNDQEYIIDYGGLVVERCPLRLWGRDIFCDTFEFGVQKKSLIWAP
jgi:hypothetical protein